MIHSLPLVWKGARAAASNTSYPLRSHWPWGFWWWGFFFMGETPLTSGTHLELFNERLSLPDFLLRAHHQSTSFSSCQETPTLISSLWQKPNDVNTWMITVCKNMQGENIKLSKTNWGGFDLECILWYLLPKAISNLWLELCWLQSLL